MGLMECEATYGLFKIGGILVSSNFLLSLTWVFNGSPRTQDSLALGATEPRLQRRASRSSFGPP